MRTRHRDGFTVKKLQHTGDAGLVADFSDGSARWFPGPDCLRDCASWADDHGLRITVISTPATIYRDLQGSRADAAERNGSQVVYVPELRMLAAIGRTDLYDGGPS